MSAPIQSCPHLCVRQGIRRRHELTRAAVAAKAVRLAVVFVRAVVGLWLRMVLDRVLRSRRAAAYTQPAARRILAALGIRLEVDGLRADFADRDEPVLVVANHVSWVDVMALWAVQPVTMVSKKEIGQWPVMGMIARAAGTIFIDRFRLRALPRTRQEVGRTLRAGRVVATFPEATTTCGRGLAPMYPAMFQTAVDVGVPVQPVCLWFEDSGSQLTTAGAYVGEQPLLDSIAEILAQRDLVLRLRILPRIMPKHVRPIDDRKALRDAAEAAIGAELAPVVGEHDAHLRPTTCQAAAVREVVGADPIGELLHLPRVRRPVDGRALAAEV